MKVELTARDARVLESLGQFTHLATPHIKSLHFNDVNRISMDRSLARLGPGTKKRRGQGLIRKVGVRAVGIRGGTPPTVWALSHKGFYFIQHPGKYKGSDDPRHTLLVADIHVGLIEKERAGLIKLMDDSRLEYSTASMRADMYLHFGIISAQRRRKFLVEVQRNGRTDVITPKINAHWNAFETSIGEGKYPRVAFVVNDEGHKLQINRQIPPEKRELFSVHMIDEFIQFATQP
jgi:hypothetical protein